jgi:hypothetical protein
MPDNLINVDVPKNEWLDLYAELGVPVGTRLVVENSGSADVFLAVQAAKPAADHKAYSVVKRAPSVPLQNRDGDPGAWAYSHGSTGRLSISTPAREGFAGGHVLASLQDGFGNPLSSYYDADTGKYVLDIHNADVHNQVINRYLHQHTATETTIAIETAPNDYQITVASAAGFAIGDYIHINTTSFETTHPQITAIVGNVFTLDRRLDVTHLVGDTVTKAIIDMAAAGQVGTMAAPQEYAMWPEGDTVFHITRILFALTHGTAGDLGLFGDLAPLANGVLIRVRLNGQYGTLTNWKTNADMKTDMFDVEFDSRSGGGGTWGTSGRGTFTETGAVLRLDGATNDQLEVYIQDDITLLDSFTMKAQGHLEGG